MLRHAVRRASGTLPAYPSHRAFSDLITFRTPHGTGKVPLSSPKVVGAATSRGERPYQEDAYSTCVLTLDPRELQATLATLQPPPTWDPAAVGPASANLARQVAYFGMFDGHGGPVVSHFLRDELHALFESCTAEEAREVVEWARSLGGYFKRFDGGALAPLLKDDRPPDAPMTLTERATLAFFKADKHLLTAPSPSPDSPPPAQHSGSTSSLLLLHSLDTPPTPFFSSARLALTTAHAGDSRIVLCSSKTGEARALTETHHADERAEAARLRRTAGALVTDSFGESRWMGAVANTRGIGDGRYKSLGVTPEPEVRTRIINGTEHHALLLLTDGVSSIASDQELLDLIRPASDPTAAARMIVRFAEEVGADDNASAMVVPLAGWGRIAGRDMTQERREYRLRAAREVGSGRRKRQ